ncbi:Molybdopterin biosynthesis MoaE [Paraphysoderma sedebokerense]|nr:Molybdopterin biosynthesis MoaE [Paraphysoderma sedebokerense]
MDFVSISEGPLEFKKIFDQVRDDKAGAISTFSGTTRNNFNGKKVLTLHYESYVPMAKQQLQILVTETRRKYPSILNIAVSHRIGLVPVGKDSVIIAVSSPHRKEGLEAVNYLIDELKRRVPIWKKEMYEDGESSWKENGECEGCRRKEREKQKVER